MKKKKGQVLVLVLLVVVVALAVGLSVASRNLTNLRTTTQTEQSQRAFNAAEGGIEDVLSRISDPSIVSGSTFPVTVGDLEASVTVNKEDYFFWTIPEGEVGQVDLEGPPQATGDVQIEWGTTSDGSPAASIEVTLVYDDGSGNYGQVRRALGVDTDHPDQTGFENPDITCSLGFSKCKTISLSVPGTPKILRIRPFWNQATVKVTADTGGSLPDQQYTVTSSATSELGLTRKIEVTKTALPQLPAVFDYVLYSEGDIVK